MSRVIKFRAWHIANNTMVYFDPKTTAADQHMSGWLCSLMAGEDSGHLMQFTGLLDKNGVEIYEGDLLRIPAKSQHEETTFNCFEVFYHDNHCIGGQNIGFCMNRMHTQGSSAGGPGYKFTPQSIENNGFVVCGNIHESPELLEVSQ